MSLILLTDPSEYKKAIDVNENVTAKLSHNEHKNNLLNKKCLRN